MLDILAELLIDLLQGKDQKKKTQGGAGQPRNPASQPAQRAGGWPEQSKDDPYIKDHPSDLEASGEGSIADIMRRMHEMATKGGADAPVLVPGYDKPPPEAARPQPARRAKPKPQPAKNYTPGPTATKNVPSAPPTPPEPAPAQTQMQTQPLWQPVAKPASEFAGIAEKLRNNPNAAREAFVYSEIFGRPLGERQ